jgi:hypothetical protein
MSGGLSVMYCITGKIQWNRLRSHARVGTSIIHLQRRI